MFPLALSSARRFLAGAAVIITFLTGVAGGVDPAGAWSETVIDGRVDRALVRVENPVDCAVRDPRTGVIIWFDCAPPPDLAP
jgi:hypothetical protein